MVVPSEEVMLLLLEKLKEVELVKLELEDMVVVGVGSWWVVWLFGDVVIVVVVVVCVACGCGLSDGGQVFTLSWSLEG